LTEGLRCGILWLADPPAAVNGCGQSVTQTTMNSNHGFRDLSYILETYYGVGALQACPTTVLWAAEKLVARKGAEEARRQLAHLNRRRNAAGRIPAYPDFGTELFS